MYSQARVRAARLSVDGWSCDQIGWWRADAMMAKPPEIAPS
jgi:hypothetical protein